MPARSDFNPNVPLPPGLDTGAIRRAIEYMERELADLIDSYFEPFHEAETLRSLRAARRRGER